MSGKRPRFPKNAAVPPILRMGGTALQHKRGPSLGTVLFHRSLCSPQWQTGRRPLRVQHKECPAADRRTQNMASADPYGRSAEASVAGRRGRRSLREVAATTQASGAQRSVCAADAKNRRKRSRNHPKGPSNAGQSLSRPPGDSSLYTREPFPGGDGEHGYCGQSTAAGRRGRRPLRVQWTPSVTVGGCVRSGRLMPGPAGPSPAGCLPRRSAWPRWSAPAGCPAPSLGARCRYGSHPGSSRRRTSCP